MEEEVHRVTIRISKVFQDTLTLDTHSKSVKIFTTNTLTCNTVDTRANRCLVPEECQTCDEVCAKKDGKSGKNDYKPSEEESKKTYECDHDCDGWPYQNCWVAFHNNNFTVLPCILK